MMSSFCCYHNCQHGLQINAIVCLARAFSLMLFAIAVIRARQRQTFHRDRWSLAPCAATIAAVVDPAVALARVPDQVRTAHYTSDHASNNRAGRTSNDGTRARANGNAFQRSGLGHNGHRSKKQHEDSSLELRVHDNLLGYSQLM